MHAFNMHYKIKNAFTVLLHVKKHTQLTVACKGTFQKLKYTKEFTKEN